MTAATMNEPRNPASMTEAAAAPDTDYATFLRVKGGISDGALRAAGLPPAQELTYDAYRAAFSPKKPPEQDGLGRMRGERPIMSQPTEEPPGPPPLGRRLILDEAPNGSWRIAADPDRYVRVAPPRRPVAKLVGMLMGIAFAFIAAATVNTIFLRSEPWRLAALPFPVSTVAERGAASGMEAPASIVVTEAPAMLQIDTASGGEGEALPDTGWSAITPAPVDTDRKQVRKSDAASGPKAKPLDLPNSTPTATQLRLPSSTPATQRAPATAP